MKPITLLLCCLFTLNVVGQDLKTALNLINSQQYEEAEKMLDELIKKEPTNGNLYFYSGDALLKDYLADTISNSKEEYARRAETVFQQGIQQAPGNVLNHVGMGAVTLLRTSDTTKAGEYFKIAEAAVPVKIKKKEYTPEKATILTHLAGALMYGKKNNFKKAIAYCERAKLINPDDPNIYLTLGDVYIKMNDASNALFNYNQALNKDPKSPLPKIKIGNIYMRVPNLVAARPYFEEAQQIDSTFAPVYRSLGELWSMGGRHDLARQYYFKYMQLSGNTIPAKIRYGNSLFRAKDYAGALQVVEEILKVDNSRNYLNRVAGYSAYEMKPPELEKGRVYMETFFKNAKPQEVIPRDYSYYGRILYKLANRDSVMLDQAFANMNKAFEMDPGDKQLLTEMAQNYYYSRRYADAIKTFELLAEKGWSGKTDKTMIARAYYNMKDNEKALQAFTDLLNENPQNVDAALYLARTASNMDPDMVEGKAEPYFEKVLTMIGSETEKYKAAIQEAYSYFGYLNITKKEFDAAMEWYDKMYNLDPNNKEWQKSALGAKGSIALREKKYVEAKRHYEDYLKLDPNNAEVQDAIANLNKVINAAQRQ
ncbi:MAG TPA: tetratricopeptide repeat protein [Bacteroidales bacterium]|jgi:tetratricopeptide (TPR) repeat protein|nr:tetratricopeptide repeat protein [Bacteroidales bacterium]